MPTLFVGMLDRLLANVLLAGARRNWPLLRLVPERWLRPLLMPTARHLRCSLARSATFLSLAGIATAGAFFLPR